MTAIVDPDSWAEWWHAVTRMSPEVDRYSIAMWHDVQRAMREAGDPGPVIVHVPEGENYGRVWTARNVYVTVQGDEYGDAIAWAPRNPPGS